MKQYNSEDAKIGDIIGTYDPDCKEMCWSYILVGDKDSGMVKLLNFSNGKVTKLNKRFLYIQGTPRNGRYLNYDQEAMMKGDLVRFRGGKNVFKITKIHASTETCDLLSEEVKVPVINAPLSYLRYARKEDCELAREGIDLSTNKNWKYHERK